MLKNRRLPCRCKVSWDENRINIVMCRNHSSEFDQIDKNDNYEEEQQFIKKLVTPSKKVSAA